MEFNPFLQKKTCQDVVLAIAIGNVIKLLID